MISRTAHSYEGNVSLCHRVRQTVRRLPISRHLHAPSLKPALHLYRTASRIALPIISGIGGTTAFPKHLSLCDLEGIP